MSYLFAVPRAANPPGIAGLGLLGRSGFGPFSKKRRRGRGLGQDDSGGDFSSVISGDDVNAMLSTSPTVDTSYSAPDLSQLSDLSASMGTPVLNFALAQPSASVSSTPVPSSTASLLSAAGSLATTGALIANAAGSTNVPPPGYTQAQWNAMTAAQQSAAIAAANSASLSSAWWTSATFIAGVPNWVVVAGGGLLGIAGLGIVMKMFRK